jgi:hypothetical protein
MRSQFRARSAFGNNKDTALDKLGKADLYRLPFKKAVQS